MSFSAKQISMAAASLAAVLAAASVAVAPTLEFEGFVDTGYTDIAGIATDCGGNTVGAKVGQVRTVEECKARVAQALVQHALEIARCLPADLPTNPRAAFTMNAYNIGTGLFCKSSMSRLALAGDLPGACAALSKYVYSRNVRDAFGRPKPIAGLSRRRAAERALCEKGPTP